jgi:hypothetical protein
MSEEKIYQRINEVDDKHTQKTDNLRNEMNQIMQTFHGHIIEMSTTAAVISERFKQLRDQVINLPKPPDQPCTHLKDHIKDHKDIRTLWNRPLIGCVIDLVKMAVIFLLAFLWGKNK